MKVPATSREDYLKAVLVLQKKLGVVRSVDVARYLGVSKPSVCRAVSSLTEGGYLNMGGDFYLRLTEEGQRIAEKTYERHCFFTKHLMRIGVDEETAEADACKLEHAISDISFQKLKEALDSH